MYVYTLTKDCAHSYGLGPESITIFLIHPFASKVVRENRLWCRSGSQENHRKVWRSQKPTSQKLSKFWPALFSRFGNRLFHSGVLLSSVFIPPWLLYLLILESSRFENGSQSETKAAEIRKAEADTSKAPFFREKQLNKH